MKYECLDTTIELNGLTIDVLGKEERNGEYFGKTAHVLHIVFPNDSVLAIHLKKPILFLNKFLGIAEYDYTTGLYYTPEQEILPEDSEHVLKEAIKEQIGDIKLLKGEV